VQRIFEVPEHSAVDF